MNRTPHAAPCRALGARAVWLLLLALQGCAGLPRNVPRIDSVVLTDVADTPLVRVLCTGAVVREQSRAFDLFWNSEHSYPLESIVGRIDDPAAARARFDARVPPFAGDPPLQARDMYGRVSVGQGLQAGRLTLHHAPAELFVDTPDKVRGVTTLHAEGPVWFSAVTLMRTATSEVMIASPYFIPGERGVELMRYGVANGVRMSVLTNAADATDEPMVHFAYARYRLERVTREGEEEIVTTDEPGATALSRLWL